MIIATTKVAKAIKHSKAQIHILSMYRQMLRIARTKDESIYSAVKRT